MMGSTTSTTDLTTDLSTFRQLLRMGDLAGARHESLLLSDDGADDAAFYLAKGVVAFFEGDKAWAEKLFEKAESLEDSPPSESFDQLFGQLLVEGAICKSLMRDARADLVEAALEIAAQLLAKHGESKQAEVTIYIEILDYVASSKATQALSLHQRMTGAWVESNDPTIQSWRSVFDLAILRLLCERTRSADRLFTIVRSRPKGLEAERYKYVIMCRDLLDNILESDMSKRSKITAARIFIFGRIGTRN
jgi:hypothetical protein